MKVRYASVDHAAKQAPYFFTVIYEFLRTVLLAVLIVMFILVFLFRSAAVDGNSMNPTLQDGDRLLLSTISNNYERGDIVVIHRDDDEPLIKRVIAVGGDTIDINFITGTVTVNGEVLEEDYIADRTYLQYVDGPEFPLTVPENQVFVMGDNRNDSLDSRSGTVGLVDTRDILGKMLVDLSNMEAK